MVFGIFRIRKASGKFFFKLEVFVLFFPVRFLSLLNHSETCFNFSPVCSATSRLVSVVGNAFVSKAVANSGCFTAKLVLLGWVTLPSGSFLRVLVWNVDFDVFKKQKFENLKNAHIIIWYSCPSRAFHSDYFGQVDLPITSSLSMSSLFKGEICRVSLLFLWWFWELSDLDVHGLKWFLGSYYSG